jgi:hypothetical protein
MFDRVSEYCIVSAIIPVASVIAVSAASARPQTERPEVQTGASPANAAPAKQIQPIRYYGGIDGMNATNLIVALQSNVAASGGYSAQAIETGGTPPPAIVDRGA